MANSHHTSSSGDIQSSINKAQVATNSGLISLVSNAIYTLQTTQKCAFLDNHIMKCRPFEAYALYGNYPNQISSDNSFPLTNGLYRRIGFIFTQKDNFSGHFRNAKSTQFKPASQGHYLILFSLQVNIDDTDTTARTLHFRMFRQGVGVEFEFKQTLKNDTGIDAHYCISHSQIVNLNNSGKYAFDVKSSGADQNNISSSVGQIVIMRINSSIATAPGIFP